MTETASMSATPTMAPMAMPALAPALRPVGQSPPIAQGLALSGEDDGALTCAGGDIVGTDSDGDADAELPRPAVNSVDCTSSGDGA